jgi:hypothetical protein
MRLLGRLAKHWPTLLACAAALLALLLLWLVRATPFQPTPALRIDALSAFFSFVLLSGTALAAGLRPGGFAPGWRGLAVIGLLLLAWATTLTPIVVVAYLLVALLNLYGGPSVAALTTDHRPPTLETTTNSQKRTTDSRRRTVTWRRAAPVLVAAGALLVGYGALALRGALFYDARTAGVALDGFAFWFVLLAAAIPTIDHRTRDKRRETGDERPSDLYGGPSVAAPAQQRTTEPVALSPCHLVTLSRLAWLYPLVRLYSMGPWNSGWSLAALLLGGGAALWAALAVFAQPTERRRLTQMCILAMALAGFALGSGAGIVAGCYALLAYVVLAQPTRDKRRETRDDQSLLANESSSAAQQPQNSNAQRAPETQNSELSAHWLLTGAIPFTAPFVAAWMLVGASVAGGVALLAGVAWLAMLLNSLAAVLAGGSQAHSDRRPLLIAAGASVVLGVGAPLVVLALIQPVVEQLQGGLTPYGDVNIWPWIGLASIDSARAQVTTLPSIAVAALMLVLSALVYLIVRLRDSWAPADDEAGPAPPLGELLAHLRAEVPWLAALGPRPTGEERRVDGE